MAKKKSKSSGDGMKYIIGIIAAAIFIYVGVNFEPGINNALQAGANNSVSASQAVQTISYNIGSPTWVLYVGLVLVMLLILAWWFGKAFDADKKQK